jgi:hypothetical protein
MSANRRKLRELRRRYLWHRAHGHKAYRLRRAYLRLKRKVFKKRPVVQEFRPWMLNGRPGNVSDAVKRLIVRAVQAGLVVTSTTGGRHTSTSFHYKGQAVDLAGPRDKMVAFQRKEAKMTDRYWELFGPDNYANVKNGRRISLGEGTFLENQHDNHVHAAPHV